jgi:hypothetical protein
VVNQDVARDPEDPRPLAFPRLVPDGVPRDAQEDLLRQVLGRGRISRGPAEILVDSWPVLLEQSGDERRRTGDTVHGR